MRRLAILALLAVLALAACGAGNPLVAAVTKTSKAKGVQISMNADIQASGATMTMTGEGAMDMAGKRLHLDWRMALPPELARQSGLGGELEFEQIMDGLVMYMKLPREAAKELPGGKRWMKIDMAKAGKAMGVDMQSMMQGGGTDPTQMLKWLETTDGVEEVGKERLDDVETTHYRAVVRLDDLADALPESQREAYRKSLKKLREIGTPEKIPMEVWVGDDDLVRRIRYAMTQNVPDAGEMKMDFTMDFSGYGTKVRIPKPPGDAFDATHLASQGAQQPQSP